MHESSESTGPFIEASSILELRFNFERTSSIRICVVVPMAQTLEWGVLGFDVNPLQGIEYTPNVLELSR